jgi:hypothetical protein
VYISVSIVPASIVTWVSISALSGTIDGLTTKYPVDPRVDPRRSYSSTSLDSWQPNQLRAMKVAGNAFATEFFSKHGGSALLIDSDTKKKYSSRVAQLYQEELQKRIKEDAIKSVPDISPPRLC